MNKDVAQVLITHHPENDTQDLEVEWVGEGDRPDESDAFLTANLMVAIYKTMLITQGIEGVMDFVEANEHVWSQGMEMEGPEGEPIEGFENMPEPESVKLKK